MTVFKDNGNVWEVPLVTVSGTVKSKHEVMLKTARVLGQCQESEKSVPVRLLLNDCSQKSYVTNSLKVQSNLKPIRKQTVYLNTFGNNNYQKQVLDVVSLNLKGQFNGYRNEVEITTLCVPEICTPLLANIDIDKFPFFAGIRTCRFLYKYAELY